MPAPKSRPATSRRPASTSTAKRRPASSTTRSRDGRTLDLTAAGGKTTTRKRSAATRQRAPRQPVVLNPNDPGVQRRASKKAQKKRNAWIALVALAFISTPIIGATMGVWKRYNETKNTKMAPRAALLHDLQIRLDDRNRQLQTLNSPTGKQRALVENGFLRDGERLLLFPKTNATKARTGKAQR